MFVWNERKLKIYLNQLKYLNLHHEYHYLFDTKLCFYMGYWRSKVCHDKDFHSVLVEQKQEWVKEVVWHKHIVIANKLVSAGPTKCL